ncbi:hypothetical protein, partial [Enterococcus entomosocium]|uniref:hypothetical protein n=1 Tax=Enterococcus entomosocium TaxID=3034352 RepID=UPI002648DB61
SNHYILGSTVTNVLGSFSVDNIDTLLFLNLPDDMKKSIKRFIGDLHKPFSKLMYFDEEVDAWDEDVDKIIQKMGDNRVTTWSYFQEELYYEVKDKVMRINDTYICTSSSPDEVIKWTIVITLRTHRY